MQDERIVPHGYPTDWKHFYEGFWAQTEEESDETGLPWPVTQSRPMPNIQEFLQKLQYLQNHSAQNRVKVVYNANAHQCKHCNHKTSPTQATEYWMTEDNGKIWVWPNHTFHYFSQHQVWPTESFVKAIMNKFK